MDDSLRDPTSRWMEEAPDFEELSEFVLLRMLDHGPIDEDALLQVERQIHEVVTWLALLSLAATGIVSCRIREDGQLVWFDTLTSKEGQAVQEEMVADPASL